MKNENNKKEETEKEISKSCKWIYQCAKPKPAKERFKKHKTKLYMKYAKKENWSPSVVKSCVIRKRGKRETVTGYNQVEFVGLYNDEMKMG